MAEAAGFVLESTSEINANAKDTKDYRGVWTLPLLTEGDKDRAKYAAIGTEAKFTSLSSTENSNRHSEAIWRSRLMITR